MAGISDIANMGWNLNLQVDLTTKLFTNIKIESEKPCHCSTCIESNNDHKEVLKLLTWNYMFFDVSKSLWKCEQSY